MATATAISHRSHRALPRSAGLREVGVAAQAAGQREAEAARYESLQDQLKAQDLAKAKATAATLQKGPFATLAAGL